MNTPARLQMDVKRAPRRNRFSRSLGVCAAGILLLGLTVLGSGCSTVRAAMQPVHPGFQPENIYLADRNLPENLRRVLVLPVSCDESRTDLTAGRDTLEPVLVSEFIKTRKFEVVRITSDDLRRLTGRAHWHAEEALPDGFFEHLRNVYACDGVLFGEITEFKAYAPMIVGWRLKLVDVHSCATIWASDEQFDAGTAGVQASVVRYQRDQLWNTSSENSDWLALNCPTRFGQYTVAQLLETLPRR